MTNEVEMKNGDSPVEVGDMTSADYYKDHYAHFGKQFIDDNLFLPCKHSYSRRDAQRRCKNTSVHELHHKEQASFPRQSCS